MKKYLALAALLLPLFGHAAEKVTAAQDPWPPFIIDAQKGISVEILKSALETQGYQLEFQNMPWPRAVDEVKNGGIDLLPGAWINEERKGFLRFSNEYMKNEVKFIKRAGDPFEFAGLDSLKGKTVGVVRGYGYGDDFMKSNLFTRSETLDVKTNLKKLQAERVDLTLEDEIVAKSLIASEKMDLSKFAFTKNALSTQTLHVACGLKNPRNEKIIDAFNKGLEEIKKNGTYAKILASYGVK